MRNKRVGAAVTGGLLLVLLGGCSVVDPFMARPGPVVFHPTNYMATGPLPSSIRRVGVMPMHSEQWRASDLDAIEAAFSAQLGKTARFEIVGIDRSEVRDRFGRDSFSSAAALPAELLPRLAADYGVDAILFLDLTHYAPYQPIAMGVRSKLVPTQAAGVLWSFDGVFDSARADVANAAGAFQLAESRQGYPVDNTAGILLSPARFAKYVAAATFDTIPLRENE